MTRRYVRGWGNHWETRFRRSKASLRASLDHLNDDDGKLVVDPELTTAQRSELKVVQWHIRMARYGLEELDAKVPKYD